MAILFFFLWSPPLLWVLSFCVSLLVWASYGKLLSECLLFHNSFKDHFLFNYFVARFLWCFWQLYQFWYHFWLYRTHNIHLSLSAKICICFSQHHAARNGADPSKDCKHILDVFMNTNSWIHIIERHTHTQSILSAQALLFTSVTMCLWNANHNDLVGMMEMTFLTGSIPI